MKHSKYNKIAFAVLMSLGAFGVMAIATPHAAYAALKDEDVVSVKMMNTNNAIVNNAIVNNAIVNNAIVNNAPASVSGPRLTPEQAADLARRISEDQAARNFQQAPQPNLLPTNVLPVAVLPVAVLPVTVLPAGALPANTVTYTVNPNIQTNVPMDNLNNSSMVNMSRNNAVAPPRAAGEQPIPVSDAAPTVTMLSPVITTVSTVSGVQVVKSMNEGGEVEEFAKSKNRKNVKRMIKTTPALKSVRFVTVQPVVQLVVQPVVQPVIQPVIQPVVSPLTVKDSVTTTIISTVFYSEPALSQIGFSSETPKEIKGFSHGSPLITVLKQIVPEGWTAKKEGAIDVNQDVSWQGGRTWVEILGSLSTQYHFTSVIDWGRREVKIASGVSGKENFMEIAPSRPVVSMLPPAMVKPLAPTLVMPLMPVLVTPLIVAPLAVTQTVQVVPPQSAAQLAVKAVALAAEQAAAQIKSREWLLSNRSSLKENVEVWAKRAGWSLAWNAEDYPVDVSTILSGDFEADNGPIAQLSVAYRAAKQPLIFRMKEGNKTLVVENQEYEQRMFQDDYRSPQQR